MAEVKNLWASSAAQKELKSAADDAAKMVSYRSAARVTAGAVTAEAQKPAAKPSVKSSNWEWTLHAADPPAAPEPAAPEEADEAEKHTPSPLRRLRAAASARKDAEEEDAMPSPLERLRASQRKTTLSPLRQLRGALILPRSASNNGDLTTTPAVCWNGRSRGGCRARTVRGGRR